MLSITLLALIVAATTIRADFHVLGQVGHVEDITDTGGNLQDFTRLIGCPSNIMNCDCFADLKGGTESVLAGDEPLGDLIFPTVRPFPDSGFFTLTPPSGGFCGAGALDFYNQGDGTWKFFANSGDGTSFGTCRPANGEPGFCIRGLGVTVSAFDLLVCETFLCK